jgi:hypothetical protein
MVKKKGKKVKIIIIIAIVLILLVFLLFPRKYQLLDGGSTGYRGFMYIYSIEDRCSFVSLDGEYYYEKGTVITIFGIEIYNGTKIDTTQTAIGHHSPEAESLMERIESSFYSEI